MSNALTAGRTHCAASTAPSTRMGSVGAGQPALASLVHRGHADAASRVVVVVGRVHGAPIAPCCSRLLHCHHRSAVLRIALAPAPAIQHHPVQPAAVLAAGRRTDSPSHRPQVGVCDLPQHNLPRQLAPFRCYQPRRRLLVDTNIGTLGKMQDASKVPCAININS